MKTKPKMFLSLLILVVAGLVLSACGGDGSNGNGAGTATVAYRVTMLNVTANQPLSPPAVILHDPGYHLFEVGEPASAAMEVLAESGDPGDVVSMANQDVLVRAAGATAGVIAPGQADAVEFTFDAASNVRLSLATMLVNTNDAFAGLDDREIGDLALNAAISFAVPAYDAGTEANSESAATVPGPAAGGQGFNAQRDDPNFIRVHPGAVTSQDGLAGSVLDGSHRWDNPVMMITVERIG